LFRNVQQICYLVSPLEIQEDKTDAIEDQVASLTEQITELKQQVKEMYGDEEDWKRMSKT
jgi:uncharacterized protein HemX